MSTHEVVLTEAEEDVGLPHAAVADDQQLCKVIVTVLLHLLVILNNQPGWKLIINRDLIEEEVLQKMDHLAAARSFALSKCYNSRCLL